VPGLFRKAALDKVSSPEQLDLMMEVTSPMGWLALITVGVMIFMAMVWAVFGAIPDLVDGRGVLMRGERLYEVKTAMAGTITKLNVTPGMTVQAGQIVAVISRDRAAIEERQADEIAIARNEEMLAIKQDELASIRRQRETQERLVRRGLKAGNVLFEYDHRITATLGEINALERETAIMRTRARATSEIKTPEAGRVVEVVRGYGDKVPEGAALMRIEPSRASEEGAVRRDYCGGKVHAIIYVPARLAGKVEPGDPARVSPLDVKREEFGYIVGRVEWIAGYAASPEDMQEKLKNDALVQTYGAGGPVFEARVCLEEDPKNKANGLKWSSSSGPEREVGSGVQCSASLVVDQRRPYTYVIPAIKRAAGV
jgi:HlyD family secretion protein